MPIRAEARGSSSRSTIDPAELEKFEMMAAEWWNADGKFKPLHKLNPVRLAFIRDHVAAHFDRDVRSGKPFAGLRMLDIGCGGGILTEPMARLGAEVIGADPSETHIEAARVHAVQSGLTIDYRATTAEALAEAGDTFDVVLAMEVIEHVADRDAFLTACARLLAPGGLFFAATINRTLKAYALAIVGAEYVLRWLPRGTHDYSKLLRPVELEASMQATGLTVLDRAGVSYNPLRDIWARSADTDVNYMIAAERRKAEPLI